MACNQALPLCLALLARLLALPARMLAARPPWALPGVATATWLLQLRPPMPVQLHLSQRLYFFCSLFLLALQWTEIKKASYVKHSVREYHIHKELKHPRWVGWWVDWVGWCDGLLNEWVDGTQCCATRLAPGGCWGGAAAPATVPSSAAVH